MCRSLWTRSGIGTSEEHSMSLRSPASGPPAGLLKLVERLAVLAAFFEVHAIVTVLKRCLGRNPV